MRDFCYCGGVLLVQQWIYLSKIVSILLGSVSAVRMTSDFGLGGIRFESRFGFQIRVFAQFSNMGKNGHIGNRCLFPNF